MKPWVFMLKKSTWVLIIAVFRSFWTERFLKRRTKSITFPTKNYPQHYISRLNYWCKGQAGVFELHWVWKTGSVTSKGFLDELDLSRSKIRTYWKTMMFFLRIVVFQRCCRPRVWSEKCILWLSWNRSSSLEQIENLKMHLFRKTSGNSPPKNWNFWFFERKTNGNWAKQNRQCCQNCDACV